MNDETRQSLNGIFNMQNESSNTTPQEAEVLPAETALTTSTPTDLVLSAPDDLTPEEIQAREDFQFSRGAIKSVATESQTTLHRAIDVANQTDSARSFEVVADLVRATLDAHRELHGLHKTAAEIRATTQAGKTPPGTVNIQQGVVFSGTGDELLRLISKDRQ